MDKLRKLLLRRLHERYPGIIHAFIKDRFDIEWEYVCIADLYSGLLLYHAIMKAAKAARQPVWNCGFGSGSFLCYLLDKGLNPLPPHWECKGCGHIVTNPLAELCFALPVKVCPVCNTQMVRDGIRASSEQSFRRGLEIRVNEEFLEAASQAALGVLIGHRVFQQRWNHKPAPANSRSYYITDKGELLDDSLIHQDEFGQEYINVEDVRNCSVELLSVVIIAQTNYPMPKKVLTMEEWIEGKPDIQPLLERYNQYMKTQGLYSPENSEERLQEMIDLLQPETWTALIEAVCYTHGTYYLLKRATPLEMVKLIRSSEYRHIMYSRESLQFYLEKKGLPAILAWQMVDQLRKSRKGLVMQVYSCETPLLKQDVLFQSVIYLWPRTHAINWLWRYLTKGDSNANC